MANSEPISPHLKPRRILVMGGTRFIGCYLVAKLREMGHSVVPRLRRNRCHRLDHSCREGKLADLNSN